MGVLQPVDHRECADPGLATERATQDQEAQVRQAAIEAIAAAAVHSSWTLEHVLGINYGYGEPEMNQALIEAIAQAAVHEADHDQWTLDRVLEFAFRDSELGMNQALIRAVEEAMANARGSALDIQDEDQVRTNYTSRRLNDRRSLFDT